MANIQQIKALLKAHASGDEDHFYSVAMQMAASEAKAGHGKSATELKDLIDSGKERRLMRVAHKKTSAIGDPRGELAELLDVVYPTTKFASMVLDVNTRSALDRVLIEQKNQAKIRSYGLSPRRKLLLVGPPGTGKTLTATALAGELGLPLYVVRLDGLITKFMGETASKLRLIFQAAGNMRGIYFFDEFDALGSHRGMTNDVGEIRRVLNSFLQMIENDASHSIIVAATNHPEILDAALFRRFDNVLQYELPSEEQVVLLLKSRLANFAPDGMSWTEFGKKAVGLSYAEISHTAEDAMKLAIIKGRDLVVSGDLARAISERKDTLRR